jgi:transposase
LITIGCDVGKSHFDVFFCGKHNKYKNETEGIKKFILKCPKDGRIILEPTGGYERDLVNEASNHCRRSKNFDHP